MRFKNRMMEPRHDWNARGPHIPLWFRVRLKRIDPELALQFIPPQSQRDREGVNPTIYPYGVWIICRYMRRTGWLWKRWTMALNDQWGRYRAPSMDTINLIRVARETWRRGRAELLERQVEDSIEKIKNERCDESRADLVKRMDILCSAYGHLFGERHVFFPNNPIAKAG